MGDSKTNDGWKYWEPLNVEGGEEIERLAQECQDKTYEAVKIADACKAAAEKGDLTTARKKADDLKKLRDGVQDIQKKMKELGEAALKKAEEEKKRKEEELKDKYIRRGNNQDSANPDN